MVVFVMRMLGEMAAASPTSGSFSAYADQALGRWAGFSIGWLYWFFWVVVLAVEATAGAKILEGWIPAVPQWAWALIVMVVLTATNLVSVGSYGEFEFWFAGIKVVAIGAFVVDRPARRLRRAARLGQPGRGLRASHRHRRLLAARAGRHPHRCADGRLLLHGQRDRDAGGR